MKYRPEDVYLVYFDEEGNEHSHSVADMEYQGTLVDPETGDDMVIDHVYIRASSPNA